MSTFGLSENFGRVESEQRARFQKSFLIALSLYALGALALYSFSHISPGTPLSEPAVLEAELVETRPAPQLYEKKSAAPRKAEASVSRDLNKSSAASEQKMKDLMSSQNQTAAPPANTVLTRGPLVEFSPAPKLPSYLKNQNLKTNVLIEFMVSAKGSSIPSLIGSSGNEELDALALKTAKTWVFQPAMQNGQVIDSKVRLRINFEVE